MVTQHKAPTHRFCGRSAPQLEGSRDLVARLGAQFRSWVRRTPWGVEKGTSPGFALRHRLNSAEGGEGG